jgi:hypothetical protein
MAGAGLLVALAMACSGSGDAARGGTSTVKPPTPEENPADTAQGSGAPSAAARTPGERRTILFLGTSLTAGLGLDPDSAYPQRIQRRIDASGLP